jgi:ketosteroid isomerase-like protein
MNEVEKLLQENRALVEHLYAAFAANDIPRLLEVLSEDIDWLFFGPPTIPFAGHYRGHEQVAAFFAKARETSEFLVFEPREITPGANHVLVQGFEKGLARTTRLTWETDWAHVFTVSSGKIVKLREYYDTSVISAAFHSEG